MTQRVWGALRILLVYVAPLFPGISMGAPGDGVSGSAHDFAGIGSPASGLCTFCHTPHKAQTQRLLWNHKLSSNIFTWDTAQTIAGTPYPTIQGDTYTGPTAKCLSCHDGSVAVGELVWWNGGPPSAPLLNLFITGISQSATTTGSLGNSHPVAMPYPYSNVPSTYNTVSNGPGLVPSEWVADPTMLGIRLYRDDGGGNIVRGPAVGQSGIECSSCHDPHNGPNVEDILFLLGTAFGICSKCHIK